MEAGIEIRNVDSFIQIDSQFVNWAVIKRGSFTTNVGDSEVYSGTRTVVTVTGVNPIIAVRCAPNCAVRIQTVKTGNSFSFYFHSALSPFNNFFKVEYWVFDSPTTENNYGIQVFNEKEVLVFDASREYMRVVGQVNYTAEFPFSVKNTSYVFKSSSLAVVTCQQAYKLGEFGSQYPEIETNSVLSTISGNTITLRDGLEYTRAGYSQYYPTRNLHSILVLDVSNM